MGTQEPLEPGGAPAETGAAENDEPRRAHDTGDGADAGDAEHTGGVVYAGGVLNAAGADGAEPGSPAVAGAAGPPGPAARVEETRHARNLPPDEPAARFQAREKPQRYARGIGQRHPTKPPDPIRPYMAPPVARRRRSDWPVMVFAMVIVGLVMVGCCIAGVALYSAYGNPFAK